VSRLLGVSLIRPRWLTAGLTKLAVLCGFIVVVAMLPGRLTPTRAGWIGWIGLGVLLLFVSGPLAAATIRLTARLGVAGAVMSVVRIAGLVGLAGAFFLFWTFVYLTLWSKHPVDSFRGLDATPRFADFFYYSVTTALTSPPGDISAHSRGVRGATMIEMLSGLALLFTYIASFVDWERRGKKDSSD
jgi:hypothetical protein